MAGSENLDRDQVRKLFDHIREVNRRVGYECPALEEQIHEVEVLMQVAETFMGKLEVVDMGMVDNIRRQAFNLRFTGTLMADVDPSGNVVLN